LFLSHVCNLTKTFMFLSGYIFRSQLLLYTYTDCIPHSSASSTTSPPLLGATFTCKLVCVGPCLPKVLLVCCTTYFVPVKWHVAVFPGPCLEVGRLDGFVYCHVERRVDAFVDIVGAVEDEECHQDEDGCKDHQPVALLTLQC